MQKLRTWMKEERQRQGITQKHLAKMCHTGQDVICRIERGVEPRITTAKKIAKILDIDWTRFYED